MILTEQDTVPRSGVRTINDCNSKRGSGGCKTHSSSESAGECKYVFYLNKLHYLVPGFKKILVHFLLFPLVFYLVGIKFLFISKVGKKFWFIYLVGIKTDFYSYQRNKLEFFSHLGNKQVIFSHLRKNQVKNKNFTVILSLVSPNGHPNTAVVNGTVALFSIKHLRYNIQLQKI